MTENQEEEEKRVWVLFSHWIDYNGNIINNEILKKMLSVNGNKIQILIKM
jgi:hypothetical protein